MKSTKKIFKIVFEFLMLTLIMGFIITQFMNTTYAVMSSENPDVVITIDENGHISQQGDLFGDELWVPDKNGRDGIIRIYNNYKSTKLTNLGVSVKLNSYKDGYLEDEVRQSFLKYMKLTIKKGRWLDFGDATIVQDKSLVDLLNGISLGTQDQLNISVNNPLDLKYTMRMDEAAGNELQRLSAHISFMIKTPLDNTNDEDNNSDNNDNPGGIEVIPQLIEEPIIRIPDINGHWAHDCIVALIENEIIQGDEKGRIRPDDYITRAEAAILVGKALKLNPKEEAVVKYKDAIPVWARGYVNITSEKYIFKGYLNGQFRPNNNITREEMIAVFTRAFKLTLDDEKLELPFADKNKIGSWALESVKSGVEDQVLTGYPDNTYRPQNKMTRAEAFTIVCKLLKYHETHVSKVQ